MSNQKRGPVLIDLDDQTAAAPAAAPVVLDMPHQNAAMVQVATTAARKPSRLARWFWSVLLALTGFIVSLAAWDYVNGLTARSSVLGAVAVSLLGIFCLILLVIDLRELAAIARLRDCAGWLGLTTPLGRRWLTTIWPGRRAWSHCLTGWLYRDRDDMTWARDRLAEQVRDPVDADTVLGLVETTLLAPLDAAAQREVEVAARQVATVTAIVPLALADVFAALTSNLRMIRRIAEIYGGRSGLFGSWHLTRTVLMHLVATGVVALGDDLIGSIAGGGVLSKVSRRFGEGVINSALTARLGVVAIEVCRPLPFATVKRPSVTALVKRSLTGLFGGA